MIIPLDPNNRGHRQAAADLHRTLLGDESPIPQLGERFCRDFYYGVLVKDGLLECDLAVHDGRYIGWVSYTADPLNFLKKGLKRHPFSLLGNLLLSVVTRPLSIRTIWRVSRDMKTRGAQVAAPGGEPFGEILSFGVLQDSSKLVNPETGERYSRALVNRAMEYFRGRNLAKIQVAVRKWYKAALLFYSYYEPEVIDNHYDLDRSYRLEMAI